MVHPARTIGPAIQNSGRARAVHEYRIQIMVRRATAVLMTLLSLGALERGPARATEGARWVTAWEAPAGGAYGPGFKNQTLRMIVTPHASGTEARVVLSNRFGAGPVTITHATIARRASGPALVPGTVKPLTFGGHESVTIVPGQEVLSDHAAITVAPFEDLAVSLAFGAPTGSPTDHFNGLQTSYYSPVGSGDQTGSLDGRALTEGTPSRFFLTAVQLLARSPAKTIVVAGDSISEGMMSPDTVNQNARWPDFLERRLLVGGTTLSVANAAISGNEVTHDGPLNQLAGGPSLENRFEGDVLSQPSLGGIIVEEGLNDLALNTASASELIAGLQSIAQRAHSAGVPVMIATLTPIGGAFYDSPEAEAGRITVNNWIRSQHVFDAVLDFAAAVQDLSDPTELAPGYDSGDHLHPNAAGLYAIAQSIDLSALRHIFGDRQVPTVATTPTVSWHRTGGCWAARLAIAVTTGGQDPLMRITVTINHRHRYTRRLRGRAAHIYIGRIPRKAFDATVIAASDSGGTRLTRRFGRCS
jgi:lysophospholipase L1-like esterase